MAAGSNDLASSVMRALQIGVVAALVGGARGSPRGPQIVGGATPPDSCRTVAGQSPHTHRTATEQPPNTPRLRPAGRQQPTTNRYWSAGQRFSGWRISSPGWRGRRRGLEMRRHQLFDCLGAVGAAVSPEADGAGGTFRPGARPGSLQGAGVRLSVGWQRRQPHGAAAARTPTCSCTPTSKTLPRPWATPGPGHTGCGLRLARSVVAAGGDVLQLFSVGLMQINPRCWTTSSSTPMWARS